MELRAIEGLLEKYLNAETTLEEETRLREYFCSGKVAPRFQEYVPLFSYITASKEESYSGEIRFYRDRKRVYAWVAVAASIVLLGGIFFQNFTGTEDFGSYEDPELALEKTKKALQMVFLYMNSGTEDLRYLQEFNNSKEMILRTK